MGKSDIDWTEETINNITGCNKISEGCKNCYAEVMTKKLQQQGSRRYKNGFDTVTLHPEVFQEVKRKTRGRLYFVNSMADTFHKDVPDSFLIEMFNIMKETPIHTYQVLTKRAERLIEFNNIYSFADIPNLWLGVTVENQRRVNRIQYLKQTDAQTKFLSCEPLISDINFGDELKGIDWVIVGGESGPNFREMKLEWAENILSQCRLFEIPYFFKQKSGVRPKKLSKDLNGIIYQEYPRFKREVDE